jgi:hypothetical protein
MTLASPLKSYRSDRKRTYSRRSSQTRSNLVLLASFFLYFGRYFVSSSLASSREFISARLNYKIWVRYERFVSSRCSQQSLL